MTAAAADDLIPRHRAAAPTQPSAAVNPAAAHPAAANGAAYGVPAAAYGPAPQPQPHQAPASAPAGFAPVSATTAGALAARYQSDGEAGKVEPLGTGWTTVTIVIGVMAALIALGGMVLSFRAVSVEMVPAFGQRWAWLVPIVVDLTVFVFSGVDLVLARLDMGHPLARWTVYGATGGTVWLNYSAGGSAAGRVAHVLMPSIWVVFVELMRHVVRRQVNLSTASHREPIPAARWFLSPWPTLKLWRRMVLWRINSYPRALDQEKMRLGAIATAREMYGRFWRFRISPLTRLQINLGEVGAGDLRPELSVQPAQPTYPAYPEVAYIPVPVPTQAPAQTAAPHAAAPVPAPQPQAAPAPPSAPARTAPPQAYHSPQGPAQAPAAPVAAQPTIPRQGGAHSHREPAAFASQPLPTAAQPMGPSTGAAGQLQGQGRAGGPALAAALAAAQAVPSAPAHAIANGNGNGATNGAAPSTATVPTVLAAAPSVPQRPVDDVDLADALRRDPRQDPQHVEFQAPPPMPPLPRRSVRESELLTAAREVERWRGRPSATRISRELGIGMPLATSLANALNEEEGPGE
ncbi:MAG TPA: DUF2637 domain-containing protein [Actinocrinis sp.]|nr:DUF2637 domain-containing protein [Actinocrinis sp.]